MKELKLNETSLKKEYYSLAKLPITKGKETTLIDFEQIVYIEAEGTYSKIVLKSNKSYTQCKNLRFFENQLPEHSFLRLHKSFLVNINFVHAIIRDKHWQIKLTEGQLIPVSDDKKMLLLDLLGLQISE